MEGVMNAMRLVTNPNLLDLRSRRKLPRFTRRSRVKDQLTWQGAHIRPRCLMCGHLPPPRPGTVLVLVALGTSMKAVSLLRTRIPMTSRRPHL
ncbi:hypothetical protein FKP32DRAFT_235464 [Trametes sanguinea]|nr:hypothetical protein FKP32DRAFT_235464 [Trametes sanguinea]